MDALSLHHTIFAKEKDSDLPLRSATGFLHRMPERDGSPTSQLFTSSVYQDLIQRQPTHPDGPTAGWDLGLALLGDPITPSEHKGLEDHQTKTKLRRLHAINVTVELLFGIWGMYATVRYFLASVDGLGDTERICALILGSLSALSVALVVVSILMPLFPQQRPRIWCYTRSLFRTCYLLLLSAGAVMNFVLVLVWHPSQLCDWDIDVAWYTSAANTTTSPCHTASFLAWVTAATLRLVVTMTFVFSFVLALRSYYGIRHPSSYSPKYSPYLSSDPEEISPVSTSSPHQLSKSVFRFTRSEDSSRTLNQSHTTLPKSNSISTLAPSTSCTGHSRSHSTPPKDVSPPRISPPTSRSTSTHITNYAPEIQSTQTVSAVIPPSSASRMLRRTSRISIAQVTSDAALPVYSPPSETPNGPNVACDPSEIRSSASWKPSRPHLDVKKPNLAWENAHAPETGDGPESFSSTHSGGESIKERDKAGDVLVYSYGYGVSGPTYPYLDTYNPQRSGRYAEAPSSCEHDEARPFSQGYRRAIPGGPGLVDASSEPRSSLSMEEEESSGEEEEYVAMMGGFVRRMATIESLGSKEAAGTLSTTGSVAHHSVRSKTPASQFSSLRFAENGSSDACSSGVPTGARDGSHSTAYLSFSSGGTGMWVNERGELLPGPNAGRGAAGSPYDRQYYTASGSSFPRMGDEAR